MKLSLTLLLALAPLALHAQDVPAPHTEQPAPAVVSAPTDKPLPPADELLKQVEKNEKRDDKLLQQYTYHLHEVMDSFDSKDDIKKSEITDEESIPIQGVRINRIVARNGKPLTAEEQKKEDASFDKRVASAKKRKAKQESKEEKDEDKQKSGLSTARMLEVGQLSNERREIVNGRPTIVFDYVGRHDTRTDEPLDAVFQKLSGTAWIDEEDKVVARFDGRFDDDFKLGLGLIVDIHKGVTFTYEEVKINDEIWLPKRIDARGKMSIFVVIFRVHGETRFEFSNYRKYHTDAKLLPDVELVPSPAPETPPARP